LALRRAVRRNTVSFPSQIPVFLKQHPAGMQWRSVLLFFVRGWSSPRIAMRFRVPAHQIWQIIEDWSVRALALGYVQVIDQEGFAACCRVHEEHGAEEALATAAGPAPWVVPQPYRESIPAAAGMSVREEANVSYATA
jgi:hypothetical protein